MEHAEQLHPPVDTLTSLQTGRFELAVNASENEARNLFARYSSENPDNSISKLKDTHYSYDVGQLRPRDLMAFDALGMPPQEILPKLFDKTVANDTPVATLKTGGENIHAVKYGRGVTLRFDIDGTRADDNNPRQPILTTARITERFAASPFQQEFKRISDQITGTERLPRTLSTAPIDPCRDPLATAVFLDDIGLTTSMSRLSNRIQETDSVQKAVQQALEQDIAYGVSVHEDESGRVFTWGKGLVRQLSIDKQSGNYTFSTTMDPATHYMEKPNQAPDIEAIPFLETQCAAELTNLLDERGLMFHPRLQVEMMRMGESERYRSVYTQLSREIAKWVNDPDRLQLSNLFVPTEAEHCGETLVKGHADINLLKYKEQHADKENIESTVRAAWQNDSVPRNIEGEAAGVLIGMIDEVLARDPAHPADTDIPVTGQRFHITDGACFDVTTYYVGAAAGDDRATWLQLTTKNDTEMLHKTHGADTYMLTQPALFNGVHLPKGSLLTKEADGYGFMRLTAFGFDEATDLLAVDPEMAKTRRNEQENIRFLGGMSMSELVKGARNQ